MLKDAIVKLKDEGKVLLRIAELKQQLDMRLPEEQFSLDELRAVVGLLAGPGVVRQLDFGDFVLLQPERINAYAAAVIRSVHCRTLVLRKFSGASYLRLRAEYSSRSDEW